STWALAGGTFDDGHAIENAEEAKAELREMLEDFCSNTDLLRVAELLTSWHQNGMGKIDTALNAPDTAEVRIGSVKLTGSQAIGFRIGLRVARQWLGTLPLSLTKQEV
ncbi:host nuclease inhibitor protein, partial [Pseudomonas aeruginosa]|nr:host nuclease inhibitor protein [Pseudomonas aeruginosa]